MFRGLGPQGSQRGCSTRVPLVYCMNAEPASSTFLNRNRPQYYCVACLRNLKFGRARSSHMSGVRSTGRAKLRRNGIVDVAAEPGEDEKVTPGRMLL